MLWHSFNHDKFLCVCHEIQDVSIFLYVDQEIEPNDKNMYILDSPIDLWVTIPKQNPHCIEISLSRICHESFEIHIQHTMFLHDHDEHFPH
jgi:hypothetical protein